MALTKVKAGNIILTTPSASSNDVTPATTQYVTTAIDNLVDTAPSTLNTLNELAAALGDDVNFSTTVTNSIATKLPLAGGTLAGNLKVDASFTVNGNVDTSASLGEVLQLSQTDSVGGFLWSVNRADGVYKNMSYHAANQKFYRDSSNITMTLASSGNVGIGTASPQETLHLFNSAQTWNQYSNIRMSTESDSYAAEIGFHRGTSNDSDRGLFLSGDGTNKHVRVLHGGNVGIGLTDPLNKFVVAHQSHGVAIDYVGATLPYQAGLFTSSTAHTQTAYGDLNIKSRSDYTTYGIGFFTASAANTPTRRMRINAAGDLQLESGAVNKGYLQLSTQSTSYALMGGNYWGYLGYKTGGYHRWFGSDGAEDMRIDTGGNVGIGEPNPDAILTIGSTGYVQEWKNAKGFKKSDTGQSGANGNYNESTYINVNSYRGVCVDYYESGHYFNNGAAYYFRHSKIYVIMEGSTLRVADVVLERSTGNRTDAIVNAPSINATGTGQFTITSTILSGFTHYVSVDAVGGGFVSIGSIG